MQHLNLSKTLKELTTKNLKTCVIQYDQFGRPLVMLNRLKTPSFVEQHDLATDITQIISGSGTIVLGGEIVGKFLKSEHEWHGKNLKGKTMIKLKKDDIIIIDAKTPHQTIPTINNPLVYLTTKQYLKDYSKPSKLEQNLRDKINKIKGLIMDVDGTMTDGKVWVNNQGEEFASFSRIDSLALLPWQGIGKQAGIISREKVSIATARATKLKIDCIQDTKDKVASAKKLLKKWNLNWDEICFVGDDVNDLKLLEKVGFSACPSDSEPQLLSSVDYVVPAKRGEHVIRLLLDLIFKIQLGKLPNIYETTFKI